jgi:hypothetical protein
MFVGCLVQVELGHGSSDVTPHRLQINDHQLVDVDHLVLEEAAELGIVVEVPGRLTFVSAGFGP